MTQHLFSSFFHSGVYTPECGWMRIGYEYDCFLSFRLPLFLAQRDKTSTNVCTFLRYFIYAPLIFNLMKLFHVKHS